MGLDFIRGTARSSTKAWNRGRTDLSNPTLFTRYPECHTRTVVARLNDGVEITQGGNVVLCIKNESLVLVRENTQIGVI
jgi:hypothetical protein